MKLEVPAFALAAAVTAALCFGAAMAAILLFPEAVVKFVNMYFKEPHIITGFVITPYNAVLGFAKVTICGFIFGGIFAYVHNLFSK